MVIIGCNNMGRKHLNLLREYLGDKIEVIGILNSSPESSQAKATELGLGYFNSVDEITKDKVDMVIIATPATIHAQYTINMLAKGIDVLLEKPFAANEGECLEVIKANKKSDSVLMLGYTEIFNPAVVALGNELKGKKLKTIEAYRSALGIGTNTDVTIVQNLMLHDISVLHFLSGEQSSGINKLKTFVHPTKNMCHYAKAQFEFNSGLKASLIAEKSDDGPFRTMKIVDENDNVYNLDFLQRKLSRNGELIHEGGNSIQNEHAYFYDCCKNRQTPKVNGEKALEIERIALKIDEDFKATYALKQRQMQNRQKSL